MHLIQLSAFSMSALQLKEEKNISDHGYIHMLIHIQGLGSHFSKILLNF